MISLCIMWRKSIQTGSVPLSPKVRDIVRNNEQVYFRYSWQDHLYPSWILLYGMLTEVQQSIENSISKFLFKKTEKEISSFHFSSVGRSFSLYQSKNVSRCVTQSLKHVNRIQLVFFHAEVGMYSLRCYRKANKPNCKGNGRSIKLVFHGQQAETKHPSTQRGLPEKRKGGMRQHVLQLPSGNDQIQQVAMISNCPHLKILQPPQHLMMSF